MAGRLRWRSGIRAVEEGETARRCRPPLHSHAGAVQGIVRVYLQDRHLVEHTVVIDGAGLLGLTAALFLAHQGHKATTCT